LNFKKFQITFVSGTYPTKTYNKRFLITRKISYNVHKLAFKKLKTQCFVKNMVNGSTIVKTPRHRAMSIF